jgi:hypothetical protein
MLLSALVKYVLISPASFYSQTFPIRFVVEVPQIQTGLEEAVKEYLTIRKPHELLGEEGLVIRTFGLDFQVPAHYTKTYYDSRRRKEVLTEFAEMIEAIGDYDASPSLPTAVDLLLEVGDLMFQHTLLDLRHQEHPEYRVVAAMFEQALSYANNELEQRGLSIVKASQLAGIKYGLRNWRNKHGLEGKHKALELALCMQAYKQ